MFLGTLEIVYLDDLTRSKGDNYMILVSRTPSDMNLINALAKTGLYTRARLMRLKSEVLKNLWWDYQVTHT